MDTSNGAGSAIIEDTKAYAAAFTQKFTNGSDQLGLVVFDGSAAVGYPTVRPWDSTITSTSTGGPNAAFCDGSSTDMVHQIQSIRADSGAGIADALSVVYIELQKAHLKAAAANGGVDDRLNSIVLMTDGVPSAVSLYLNNPNNANADNVIKATSGCANKTIATNQQDADHMMLSWFAIPYNTNSNPPYSTSSGNHYGMFLMASLDPNTTAHTASWWMSNGSSSSAKDATTPNPSTPYTGCTTLYRSSEVVNDDLPGYFTQIPAFDRYGNSLTGNGYTNSAIVKSNGGTLSVYNGTALDRTKVDRDYHWGLAMWNAADSAATRIRADVN